MKTNAMAAYFTDFSCSIGATIHLRGVKIREVKNNAVISIRDADGTKNSIVILRNFQKKWIAGYQVYSAPVAEFRGGSSN